MFLQMNIRGNIVQFSGQTECKALKPENKMLSASHSDALHQCTHFHLKLYRSINGWTFLKNGFFLAFKWVSVILCLCK